MQHHYCIKIILTLLALVMSDAMSAQSVCDNQGPFGWANCTSMTQGDSYTVTGGGAYDINMPDTIAGKRIAVLKSDGKNMRKTITRAIEENDIVILDGAAGDFFVDKQIKIDSVRNKTVIGRNNARICTQFFVSPEITKLMDDNKVLSYGTDAAKQRFTLPNGQKVKEEREYVTRKLLQETLQDPKENYRSAGTMSISRSENIIVRNLTFVGPGAIDVGGSDLLTITHHSRNIWIDHCEMIDGMDGCLDINGHADFITISWCRFRYTDRTYIHANTSLVGSSDRELFNGVDNLNVTYACCHWDTGCDQRMPMVRFGTVHVLNNYYTCQGNTAAVNPRRLSEVLVEGCYFDKGVEKMFKTNDAKAYVLKNNHYTEKFKQPENLNDVCMPYRYNAIPVAEVPEVVGKGAGVIK